MRFQLYAHLSDNITRSNEYHSNLSKSELFNLIDSYLKDDSIDGLFIRPFNIQNPPSETKKEN